MHMRSLKRPASSEQDHPARKKARKENTAANKLANRLKTRVGCQATTCKYHHIREGHGGTYIIDPSAPFIGTDDCFTCLGVYFAIDEKRCFLAHINIEPLPSDGIQVHEADRRVENYQIGVAAQRSIVWWMKKNLNDEAWSEDWGPVTQLMRDSLVMICPNSNIAGKTFIGDAVLAGVKEFLGILNSRIQPADAPGFVVTHTGGAEHKLALLMAGQDVWEAVKDPVGMSTASTDGKEEVSKGRVERADRKEVMKVERAAWEWNLVRHDGSVAMAPEEGGMEGPYHVD